MSIIYSELRPYQDRTLEARSQFLSTIPHYYQYQWLTSNPWYNYPSGQWNPDCYIIFNGRSICSCYPYQKNVLNVSNIYRTMFLTINSTHAKGSTPSNLNNRPSKLSYFSFKYELDAKITIDERINYKPWSLNFCLKLPQYIYYPESGNVESLFSPPPIIQNQ